MMVAASASVIRTRVCVPFDPVSCVVPSVGMTGEAEEAEG